MVEYGECFVANNVIQLRSFKLAKMYLVGCKNKTVDAINFESTIQVGVV